MTENIDPIIEKLCQYGKDVYYDNSLNDGLSNSTKYRRRKKYNDNVIALFKSLSWGEQIHYYERFCNCIYANNSKFNWPLYYLHKCMTEEQHNIVKTLM